MPVGKLQLVPVALSCTDPPQCPGRDAERERAGTFRVAFNYAALLFVWLPCFLAQRHQHTATPSCTFPFLGHLRHEVNITCNIHPFLRELAGGWRRARTWKQWLLGGWRINLHSFLTLLIAMSLSHSHRLGACLQCGSSNDLAHQRQCAPSHGVDAGHGSRLGLGTHG